MSKENLLLGCAAAGIEPDLILSSSKPVPMNILTKLDIAEQKVGDKYIRCEVNISMFTLLEMKGNEMYIKYYNDKTLISVTTYILDLANKVVLSITTTTYDLKGNELISYTPLSFTPITPKNELLGEDEDAGINGLISTITGANELTTSISGFLESTTTLINGVMATVNAVKDAFTGAPVIIPQAGVDSNNGTTVRTLANFNKSLNSIYCGKNKVYSLTFEWEAGNFAASVVEMSCICRASKSYWKDQQYPSKYFRALENVKLLSNVETGVLSYFFYQPRLHKVLKGVGTVDYQMVESIYKKYNPTFNITALFSDLMDYATIRIMLYGLLYGQFSQTALYGYKTKKFMKDLLDSEFNVYLSFFLVPERANYYKYFIWDECFKY